MEEKNTIKEEKKEGNLPEKEPKKKAKWKRVVSGVLTALIVLLVVVCGLFVMQTKLSKKFFLFGYAAYYVLTGSMEPTIMTGDVILVEKVSSLEDLKEGDIITYYGKEGEFAGKTVTHRIRRIEGETIVTRGDSERSIKDDPAITYNDVIGRYVKTSSFLTSVYTAFTSKYGFLFIVFIPLIVLLVVQIVNFRRACRMDKDGRLPEEKSEEEIKEQAIKEKEEEIKRKAIEEYLASKKRLEKAARKHKKKE